jgi:hypothetical protein
MSSVIGFIGRRIRWRRETAILANSGAFERDWYLRRYPDVADASMDPIAHYVRLGSEAGRMPNRFFDPSWYRAQNLDVANNEVEPLVHYLTRGSREGIRPHPLFDPAWYREEYPDTVAVGLDPLAHFILHGAREGRRTNGLPPSNWDRVFIAGNDMVAPSTAPTYYRPWKGEARSSGASGVP